MSPDNEQQLTKAEQRVRRIDNAVRSMRFTNEIMSEMKHNQCVDRVVVLADLMGDPMRAIHTCISKGQLQKLCTQTLAQNMNQQTEIKLLKEKLRGLGA